MLAGCACCGCLNEHALVNLPGDALEYGPITYIGAGGNTTPTHIDYYENSLAVVQGSKTLTL